MIGMKAKYLVALLFLFFPALGTADTIILKNGKSIEVKKVWEEDDLIKGEVFGSVIGYPKDQVERIEIGENGQAINPDSGFIFDVWRSGISIYEFMDIAERNDVPIHRDGLISVNKNFNPIVSRKYAETHREFYYKDQILGKWARVDLVFTPKSKQLYTLSINWSGTGVSNKSDFFSEIQSIMNKKYGKHSDTRKEILFQKIFWDINHDAYAMLQGSSSSSQLHYFDKHYLQIAENELATTKAAEHQNALKQDANKF